VDQSILTFHSPEIEFDDSVRFIDSSELKLRIVGMVPITSSVSDVDIITSTPAENPKCIGFYKETLGSENISRLGAKGLNTATFWIDTATGGNLTDRSFGFATYPWHRNGSLNNHGIPTGTDVRPAMLSQKKMSNLKYSYQSSYYSVEEIWNCFEQGDTEKTGISGISIFDSNEQSLIKIPAPKNSHLPDISYYGNVDKIINVSRTGDKKDGYPIVGVGGLLLDTDDTGSILFRAPLTTIVSVQGNAVPKGTEPCRIKYKSTPHAALALNYSTSGAQRILPTIQDGYSTELANITWDVNKITTPEGLHSFWDTYTDSVSQDVIYSP